MVPSGRKWPDSRTVTTPTTRAAAATSASATGRLSHGDQPYVRVSTAVA